MRQVVIHEFNAIDLKPTYEGLKVKAGGVSLWAKQVDLKPTYEGLKVRTAFPAASLALLFKAYL